MFCKEMYELFNKTTSIESKKALVDDIIKHPTEFDFFYKNKTVGDFVDDLAYYAGASAYEYKDIPIYVDGKFDYGNLQDLATRELVYLTGARSYKGIDDMLKGVINRSSRKNIMQCLFRNKDKKPNHLCFLMNLPESAWSKEEKEDPEKRKTNFEQLDLRAMSYYFDKDPQGVVSPLLANSDTIVAAIASRGCVKTDKIVSEAVASYFIDYTYERFNKIQGVDFSKDFSELKDKDNFVKKLFRESLDSKVAKAESKRKIMESQYNLMFKRTSSVVDKDEVAQERAVEGADYLFSVGAGQYKEDERW